MAGWAVKGGLVRVCVSLPELTCFCLPEVRCFLTIAHTRLSIIVVGRPDISLGFPLFSKIVLFLLGSKSHFAASKLKGGLQALTFCQELVV